MRVVATSDFHGRLPTNVPGGDVLVIAGDVTPVENHDRKFQANWLRNEFTAWVADQPHELVIWCAGNHDLVLAESKTLRQEMPGVYLQDEEWEYDGVKFYASPYAPEFGAWAFMTPDIMLHEVWRKIPEDVDVLITHGPPYGILDITMFGNENVGSKSLREHLDKREFPNLRLHVFGHIHESFGTMEQLDRVYANVSHVNAMYNPRRDPVVFEL